MAINSYQQGQRVRVTGTFTLNSVATDPTAITFAWRNPAGTLTTLTYGTDAALVRSSAGVYYVDLSTATSGVYTYRFRGTGTVETADSGQFTVLPSDFD